MRFITEDVLRTAYRTAPFTTYQLMPETRLTPGARQFIVDYRITLQEADAPMDTAATPEVNAEQVLIEVLFAKLIEVETAVLQSAAAHLQDAPAVAQELARIARTLARLRTACMQMQEDTAPVYPDCRINAEVAADSDQGDCFVLDELVLHLPNCALLLELQQLKNRMRTMITEINMLLPETHQWQSDAIMALSRSINRVSHLMCEAKGGETCHRI